VAVGNQAIQQVNAEVNRTAMARMFNLRNVLELVKNCLNNGAMAGQKLGMEMYQLILHIAARLGEKLDAQAFEQLLSQRGTDMSFIGENLAHGGHLA